MFDGCGVENDAPADGRLRRVASKDEPVAGQCEDRRLEADLGEGFTARLDRVASEQHDPGNRLDRPVMESNARSMLERSRRAFEHADFHVEHRRRPESSDRRQDLATLLGPGQVLVVPLPAGVVVQRHLRGDVLQLQANAARSQVQLQVRWVLSAGAAASSGHAVTPPTTQLQTFSAPVEGADVDAIVAAHRLVLWRLAQSLAASAQARERP